MTKRKKTIGRKNTVITAIPKPLKRYMISVQLELQQKEDKKKRGKPKKVTLLEAGLEIYKRARK